MGRGGVRVGGGGCRHGPTDESGGIMVDSLVIWFYHVFPYRHFLTDVHPLIPLTLFRPVFLVDVFL